MAWENPPTWDADDPWLHTDANQYVTNNTVYLYGQLGNAFVLNEWSTTAVTINNSTSETSILTFVVEADELAGANGFRAKIGFTFVHSGGASPTATLRLKFGGTTLATLVSDVLLTAKEVSGFIDAIVYETAENTQSGLLQIAMGGPATGQLSGGESMGSDYGVGAVDSSSARNLEVTVQLSVADSDITFTKRQHEVHKLTAA
jgi:hypothetical protein